MSIMSSLRSQISNLFSGVRSSISRVFPLGGRPEVYPDINAKNAIKFGFDENVAVYSIVMKYARKFGSIPRFVYDASVYEEKGLAKRTVKSAIRGYWVTLYQSFIDRRQSKAYQPFADKPINSFTPSLTELINRPNPYLGQDLFYEGVCCYWKILGESMIWLNRGDLELYRNDDGTFDDTAINKLPVLEMYILPADQIAVVPDPMNVWGILGYKWLETNVFIRKDDVIHWKSTNLDFSNDVRSHLRGLSPLKPGRKTLEMNNSMTDSSVRMAQNDGARFLLFNELTGANMTPAQQTDIKAVIDRKINNNDVKSAVAVVQGKWGGIDLGKSAIDLDLLNGKKFSWQELCFLFDVPYEFFDSQVTYANKEAAMFGWITNSMEPASKQLDGEMNRMLLKAFNLEGKAFIACDYTNLPEVKQKAVETAVKLQSIWSITPDDIRESLGYESLGGQFAEPWVPSSVTPLSEASVADGMQQEIDRLTDMQDPTNEPQ